MSHVGYSPEFFSLSYESKVEQGLSTDAYDSELEGLTVWWDIGKNSDMKVVVLSQAC